MAVHKCEFIGKNFFGTASALVEEVGTAVLIVFDSLYSG